MFTALMQAAAQLEHFRLPEVFAGYDRDVASKPVRYPVACNPQALAAGAMPHMLASVLGLRLDAFNVRLEIVRPSLPEWLDWLTIRKLHVGRAELDLRYERSDQGARVAVTRNPRNVRVQVQY